MSVKERNLALIDRKIFRIKEEGRNASSPWQKRWAHLKAWAYELYYEIEKNDVLIRAESLSYFTLFSIMPLIAGVFLLLGIISQFAPVQKEFEDLLANFLQAIPDEQRDVLLDFILQFKDDYLSNLTKQSASIGIFALSVLIWVVAKVFFNIESLMNRIWVVKYDRPMFERLQNFVFCMVILPLAYIIALSLPGVIEHFGQKKVGLMLRHGIPFFMIYFSLTFIFRYFPNTVVKWKSAHLGATISTLLFGLSNFFLSFYFRFGTQTAYGKAAILPIFAFLIYVSWLIFILGVEVSLLAQTSKRYGGKLLSKTTLVQAMVLEKVAKVLEARFQKGEGLIQPVELAQQLDAPQSDVESALEYLREREVVVRVAHESERDTFSFLLSRSLTSDDLLQLIKDYLDLDNLQQTFDVQSLLARLKQS